MLRQFTEAGPDCRKLRILRSCSFTFGRRHPLRAAVADFHGPDYSARS